MLVLKGLLPAASYSIEFQFSLIEFEFFFPNKLKTWGLEVRFVFLSE
jgi:hypothetical protein